MKVYRLDVCYYGTLNLRAARDAYLGSLGKDEPSEKKLPSFGVASPTPTPPPSASAAASTAASVKLSPKSPALTVASAGGAKLPDGGVSAIPERRPEPPIRLPYERTARACVSAMNLKEPAMAEADAAVAAFANYANDLASNLTRAAQYYGREDYKKDALAGGKDLDKKLREAFAKLDELEGSLDKALTAWHQTHPADPAKMEEGEKLFETAFDGAAAALLLVTLKKAEPAPFEAATKRFEASVTALKTFGADHAGDVWARQTGALLESFLKTLKETKVNAAKTFDPDAYITAVSQFTALVEARHRAQMAQLRVKAQAAASAEPEAPH